MNFFFFYVHESMGAIGFSSESAWHPLEGLGGGRWSLNLNWTHDGHPFMNIRKMILFIKGDFKNNASISLINVYRLSKADLLLKLILRYVINVFLASCQVSSL